jgi:hypothetical protein
MRPSRTPCTAFDYLWRRVLHNHPKTAAKISSRYLYYLMSHGCHRRCHIFLYFIDESSIRHCKFFRTRPDRPWGPPCLLYNRYRVIQGVKRPGRGVYHPPSYSAEVKERVELYLYSCSGPSKASSNPITGLDRPLRVP